MHPSKQGRTASSASLSVSCTAGLAADASSGAGCHGLLTAPAAKAAPRLTRLNRRTPVSLLHTEEVLGVSAGEPLGVMVWYGKESTLRAGRKRSPVCSAVVCGLLRYAATLCVNVTCQPTVQCFPKLRTPVRSSAAQVYNLTAQGSRLQQRVSSQRVFRCSAPAPRCYGVGRGKRSTECTAHLLLIAQGQGVLVRGAVSTAGVSTLCERLPPRCSSL
jgi:hypothetical protein